MNFLCIHCKTVKPELEFYAFRKSKCRECTKQYNRNSYHKHIETRRLYDKNRPSGWNRNDRMKYEPSKEAKWGSHLLRQYGLSKEQFYEMWERQNRVCAICMQECNNSNNTKLCVDHCHSTGKVRGLLCFKCNTGLGRFNDSPELLERAADYLRG